MFALALVGACCTVVEAKWQQKEFIITMWCPPPATDENLAILARDQYTLTGAGIEGDRKGPAENILANLDTIHKHGLKGMVFSPLFVPATLENPELKAQLDALIDSVKNHPALDSYHIIDEPSALTFPDWAKIVNYLKQRDPDHLTYINLFPTYASQQQLGVSLTEKPTGPLGYPDNFAGIGADNKTVQFYNEHLNEYIDILKPELISYDHYHFLAGGNDGAQYFLNIALIRAAALKAGVPFLNIVQACTIEKSWRLVNEEEMRWLAFTTMAYGAKGLSWFLYWGPESYGGMYQEGKRMPLADFGARINKDITALGPELMKLESTEVYQSDPLPLGAVAFADNSPVKVSGGEFVVGLFKGLDAKNVFMIMNRDYKNKATAKITLNSGKGKLWIFSRTKNKWGKLQAVTNGTVTSINLAPGDGQLYKITD